MNIILKNKLSKFKTQEIIFFAFLVLYAFFTIYLGYIINIWEDEAYSLNTTSLSLKDVVFESYNFEGQPPVYFLLLTLWRLLNPGIFFARLFSIIFIGLAAFIFDRVVHFVSGTNYSKWLVVIFLLNPFAVWAAMEIRTYAFLIFLSTILIYFFIQYITGSKKNHLYYFLIICLIGLYTQYFFAFLIAAIAFTLLIFKGWRAFFSLCLYLIPVVILFLPNLFFIFNNLAMAHSYNPDYSLIQRLSLPVITFQNIVLALNLIPSETWLRWSTRIIFMLLVIMAYLKLYKGRKTLNSFKPDSINALLVCSFLLVVFFTFYLFITGIKFSDRYMAIGFPLIILLFVIFTEYSFNFKNFIYSTISVFFIILLIKEYSNPIKTYDYASVAHYIGDIELPGEPVLLNSSTISEPFEYYYKGSNKIIPLPDTFKIEKNGFQVLISDTTELVKLIKSINSQSLLLINDNLIGYSSNLKLTSKMMDQCLNSHFTIALDTLFFGNSKRQSLRIRRLERI